MGCGCKGNSPQPPQPIAQPATQGTQTTQSGTQTTQTQNRSTLQEGVKKQILKYYKK